MNNTPNNEVNLEELEKIWLTEEEVDDLYERQVAWKIQQEEDEEGYWSGKGEEMDGDFDSAMESAGLGTDEDYNHYCYGDE